MKTFSKFKAMIAAAAIFASSTSLCQASVQGFYNELYDNLVSRNESFSIVYDGYYKDVFNGSVEDMFNKVTEMHQEGSSDDFDYLERNIEYYSVNIPSIGKNSSEFYFEVTYREPLDWLNRVNKEVAQVLPELNQGSTVERIKNIHDYVVKRITYDDSLTKYTAYEGIVERSTVCQGYSLLMYKMLTEAGIPARYVSGDAGQRHGWNLVKVGSKWYFIDATWDDPVGGKPKLRYDYFLIGLNKLSKDHTLDDKFLTSEFLAKYPISKTDYDYSQDSAEEPVEDGDSANYNFDIRQAVRQMIITSFDEVKEEQQDNLDANTVKLLQNVCDLQKQIMVSSFMALTDEQLYALLNDSDKIDAVLDFCAEQLETTIYDPILKYISSSKFEKSIASAIEAELENVDVDNMSEEVLDRYAEEFAERKAWELLNRRLRKVSEQESAGLIETISTSIANYLEE